MCSKYFSIIKLCFFIALALFVISANAKNSSSVVTLREAILIALRYNPNVDGAEIQRVVDKFNVLSAFWAYEPHYQMIGTANYTSSVSAGAKTESNNFNLSPSATLLTPLGTVATLTSSNPITQTTGQPHFYNPAVTFSVNQPLLQGFGPNIALAPLHLSENQECNARLAFKNTIMQTITTIIGQYVGVVQAQNSIKSQILSLQNAVATLKQQEAYLKTGRIAATNLVEFQVSVANQQLSLQQLEVALIQQKRLFLISLGIDPNADIAVTDSIKFDDYLPPLKEGICLAYRYNIAYQQELIALKNAKIAVALAEDQQKWILNLSASRTQGGGSGGPPNGGLDSLTNGLNSNTSVGLNLLIPIDNLNIRKILVQAKVASRQEFIRYAALRRQIINDVTNAYATVENQKQQIVQAKRAVDLAQQSLDIANIKLRFGRITPFEVSTLQLNLISSQLTYINTVATYYTNVALLDQIIGITLDRWHIQVRY